MKTVTVTALNHRGNLVLMLSFEKDQALISICKKLEAQYSATHRGWYIPWGEGQKKILEKSFHGIAEITFETKNEKQPANIPIRNVFPKATELSLRNQENLDQFISFLRSKRFAESTIKNYSSALRIFLHFYKDKSVDEITPLD
ncbi:MAG: phage integrase N-terminal SAM-like domain-containing protein [Brumimicrobium sp.]|nr:phage integrase N-terminal SAM-like domain-containing protein [Brumimicrobium sp.]